MSKRAWVFAGLAALVALILFCISMPNVRISIYATSVDAQNPEWELITGERSYEIVPGATYYIYVDHEVLLVDLDSLANEVREPFAEVHFTNGRLITIPLLIESELDGVSGFWYQIIEVKYEDNQFWIRELISESKFIPLEEKERLEDLQIGKKIDSKVEIL